MKYFRVTVFTENYEEIKSIRFNNPLFSILNINSIIDIEKNCQFNTLCNESSLR